MTVHVWDAVAGRELLVLDCGDRGGPPETVVPALAGGRRILTEHEGSGQVWDSRRRTAHLMSDEEGVVMFRDVQSRFGHHFTGR